MNGAQALLRTLTAAGVEALFTNPGTSEMHAVAALDDVPSMRAVLALFEGVATGAADGWARMTGRPAAVLLHLGPGLANGTANLHNAHRAGVPLLCIVGEHARDHRGLGAPLESDIEALAGTVGWVRTCEEVGTVGSDAAAALVEAGRGRGRVATLVLPADVSWGEGGLVAPPPSVPGPPMVADDRVEEVAELLRGGEDTALLLGGDAPGDAAALDAAVRVADEVGARVLTEVFPTRLVRGQGVAPVERLAYRGASAAEQLAGVRHLVLIGAQDPVNFFAYPDRPGRPRPDDCVVHELAGPHEAAAEALRTLAVALDVEQHAPRRPSGERPSRPSGELTARSLAAAVGAVLPEDAIIVDEALTSGFAVPAATVAAPAHDLLTLTGGSIGFGLPQAVGAAIAAPDRPVLALQADGSAMYTLQALWTMAREQLDVTVVLCNNASYDILKLELGQVGAVRGGERAGPLFSLDDPRLGFCALAAGCGVPASRATSADQLVEQLEEAVATPGPSLVEAMLPGIA